MDQGLLPCIILSVRWRPWWMIPLHWDFRVRTAREKSGVNGGGPTQKAPGQAPFLRNMLLHQFLLVLIHPEGENALQSPPSNSVK